jgi:CheY-like chemotaxis protein
VEQVDFSEMFTLAARQVVPAVLLKSQSFFFDYRGPRINVPIGVPQLRRTLHRILCGAIDCLRSGFVMFIAEAELQGEGCKLTVTAAGSGSLMDNDVIDSVLRRLEMVGVATGSGPRAGRVAFGRCPITEAELEFSCLPNDGMLLRGTFRPATFEVLNDDGEAAVPWGPSRAWIISSEDAVADSLTRRLQRLGWAVTRFDSCAHAQDYLTQASRRSRKPELVVMFQFDAATPAAALHLREMLPPTTKIAYSVAAGAEILRTPESLPGCEICIYPFSPAELLAYTQASGSFRAPPSGDTVISPLLFADRPRVLVVDDNELNRVVACGLLESLGYETTTADHGLAAIDQCRKVAPHAVLMDIDMPVLDGLDATRELRRLQRVGEITPCAIVAATATTSRTQADRCYASGMDGYLSKPLKLPLLRAELRRVTLL